MSTTGIIFGKFAPLHNGHIKLINEASLQCDVLLVLVSFDNKFQKTLTDFWKEKLTSANRVNWLRECYGDMNHIIIDVLDESDLKGYPNSWDEYNQLLRDKCIKHFNEDSPTYFFTSETEYDTKLTEYFPSTQHKVIDSDRIDVPISATKIRNDLGTYWDYLPRSTQKTLTKTIAIVGTESSGKSTLCKLLANKYDTIAVNEFAKNYIIEYLDSNENNIVKTHYPMFARGQLSAINNAKNYGNKFIIADTNALVTGFYEQLYTGSISYAVENCIRNEKYDLVIYLDDGIPWVADGLRHNGTDDQRLRAKTIFESLLLQYDIEYTKINGSYKERYDAVSSLIEKLIN